MRIGFYAPMKAPDHPVPSGDRQMARLLIAAMSRAGHEVAVMSRMRGLLLEPDEARAAMIAAEAAREVDRLAAAWGVLPAGRPDLVFAYHLHYKAPDLIGLPLARRFGLPYVTAEASYARKRDAGPWADRQAQVAEAVRAAAVNLCFTENDRRGLLEIVTSDRLAALPPFIDAEGFAPDEAARPSSRVCELVTLAMMRPGDKLASYLFLVEALAGLEDLDWRLTAVGDGPARGAVEKALAALAPGRVRFVGALTGKAVAATLREADLFVWPGLNEAFGLCYLEAAAAGLACVAVAGEGTPSVIRHERTGLLTDPDPARYGAAVARLIADRATRAAFGRAAARFVRTERSLPGAAAILDEALRRTSSIVSGRVSTHG